MADNFDLQGWMREQKQGPYTGPKGAEKVALKSSKPKSKTGLNEGLMGMMDLQAINSIMREEDIPANDENPEDQPGFVHEEEMDEAHNMMPIQQKWELIPIDRKEEMLDSVDSSEEGLADYAYMGWAMVPDEIKSQLEMLVSKEPVSTPDEDEDEKTSAMAMKQAKKGAKAVKGLNPTKDIHDLLYGDDEEDGDLY